MTDRIRITDYFNHNLAILLSEKILKVDAGFDSEAYIHSVKAKCPPLSYTMRIKLHAEELRKHLPEDYAVALNILNSILGPENPNETGMFTNYYWILPIGKFTELYGLDDYDISLKAIGEITKRNTGEYAIRPYIRMYPKKTIKIMKRWSASKNFHLRRLASEGLRPKLPWSSKLDTFVENPKPVFEILETLKEDPIKFVQKSVANHLTDYLKVNYDPTRDLILKWRESDNPYTQWIIKRATRKISV